MQRCNLCSLPRTRDPDAITFICRVRDHGRDHAPVMPPLDHSFLPEFSAPRLPAMLAV
jgi:hypothetical protein